jgi:type IV pilus assembly protein PilN
LIQVNLLPGGKKRAARRSSFSLKLPKFDSVPRNSWVVLAGVLVIALGALSGFLYLSVGNRRAELEVAIAEARSDSARYADLIQQNDALLAREDSIAQRVAIIQEIDGDRYVWSHILDEVARALPDYTWLERIAQVSLGGELQLRIEGRVGNNFALTQFMENLEASLFLRNVDLISTDQVIADIAGADRILNQFVVEVFYEPPPPELLETVPLFASGPSGP